MQRSSPAISILIAVLWIAACSSKPALDQPSEYKSASLEFKYPRNWKLKVVEKPGPPEHTSIKIVPSDGVILIFAFNRPLSIDVEEFAARLIKGTNGAFAKYSVAGHQLFTQAGATQKQLTRTIDGSSREGREISMPFEIVGEKIPMTIQVFSIVSARSSFVIFYQTTDEDFPRDRPGFELVLDSMKML